MNTPASATAAAIIRLETARRVLGHVATIPSASVRAMFRADEYPGAPIRTGLIRYALALVEAQEATTADNLPTPVIPEVDVANLRVQHVTCTRRTALAVEECRVTMTRTEPLDPNSPRDIALWMLVDGAAIHGERLFELPTVFAWPSPQSRASRGEDSDRLSRMVQLRVLEAIAVLVASGVTLEAACARSSARGIPANPERVRGEIEARRVGLWMANRPWCQDAHLALTGSADLPEWACQATDAMRTGTGWRRQGGILTAPAPAQDEPLADWERELTEGATGRG